MNVKNIEKRFIYLSLIIGMIFMILESFNFAVDAGGFMYANY